jgi:processive 1,2-diacylglycerol beta-glucosyltransferase
VLGRWLDEPATYAAVRANFLRLRYEEDPTTVIDELVALGNEVARAELPRQPFPPADGSVA